MTLSELQDFIKQYIISTANTNLRNGILAFFGSIIIAVVLFYLNVIAYITVIGVFWGLFMIYKGVFERNPNSNAIYKALVEAPRNIISAKMITNYIPDAKGNPSQEVTNYIVEIVHENQKKIEFNFDKTKREEATKLVDNVLTALSHLKST